MRNGSRRWWKAPALLGVVVAMAFAATAIVAIGREGQPPKDPGSAALQEASDSRVIAPYITRDRPGPLTRHELEQGQTINTVATLYGVDTSLLLTLNDIDDPTAVPAGTILGVPEPPPPPATLPCGDLLAPVDKEHALPADCTPESLSSIPEHYSVGEVQQVHSAAYQALVSMLDAAAAQGHELAVRSAYRSYSEQEQTFQFWVDQLGFEEASRVSAQAGHSEHQLGTAVDITSPEVGYELTEAFANTAGGQWLAANAPDYGFVLSYPEGEEDVTGFVFEPWHYRYIGPQNAQDFEASGLTLNQYLAQEWLPGRYLVGGELE